MPNNLNPQFIAAILLLTLLNTFLIGFKIYNDKEESYKRELRCEYAKSQGRHNHDCSY